MLRIVTAFVCVLCLIGVAQGQKKGIPRKTEQARVIVKGTRLSFIPPVGMYPLKSSSQVAVWVNKEQTGSYLFEESPLPLDSVMKRLEHPGAFLEGAELTKHAEPFSFESMSGNRVYFRRTTGLVKQTTSFGQIFVSGDSTGTALLILGYSDTLSPTGVEKLVDVVKTVRWDRAKAVQGLSMADYEITPADSFRVKESSPVRMELLSGPGTEEGQTDTMTQKRYYEVRLVANTLHSPTEDQMKEYVDHTLQDGESGLRVEHVLEFNKILIGGVQAYETISSAYAGDSPDILYLYCTILFHPENFISFVGLSRDGSETGMNCFKSMTRSFKKKKGTNLAQDGCADLVTAGDLGAALKCYNDALETEPKNLTALLGKANVQAKTGKNKDAEATYTQLLDQERTIPAAFAGRARVRAKLKEYTESIADYDMAIGLNADDRDLVVERLSAMQADGRFSEVEAQYEHLAATSPSANLYNGWGEMERGIGKYDKSIEYFSKAIELDKDYAKAYANRGETQLFQGKRQAALNDLTKALTLDAGLTETYATRAELRYELCDYQGALSDFAQYSRFRKAERMPAVMSGFMRMLLGKPDQAMGDYDVAQNLDSHQGDVYLFRGIGHMMLHQYAKAIEQFNKATGYETDMEARTWLYAAEAIQFNANVAEKTMRTHLKYLALSKQSFDGAEGWFVVGDLKESDLIAVARKADEPDKIPYGRIATQPANSHLCDAYFTIGLMQYASGLKIGAKTYWKKCLETKCTGVSSYHVAKAYLDGKWK